jgi:hypothetical protein
MRRGSSSSRPHRACLICRRRHLRTLTTDQFDYHPGETITISGSGWESGEVISMVLSVDPPTHADVDLSSAADEDGKFTNTDYIVQRSDDGRGLHADGYRAVFRYVRTAGFTDSDLGLAQLDPM